MKKQYEIRIVGTGPASTGNTSTDADLLLQSFLQQLKTTGHEISAANIKVNGLRIVIESGQAHPLPPSETLSDQPVIAMLHALHADVRKLLSQGSDSPKSPKQPEKKKGGAAEKKKGEEPTEEHQEPGNAPPVELPPQAPTEGTGTAPPEDAPPPPKTSTSSEG